MPQMHHRITFIKNPEITKGVIEFLPTLYLKSNKNCSPYLEFKANLIIKTAY